ncbi:MAG: response regulator transcription factor [Duncaniella sp.]|nr:response regulator transcription factor [Duncaniella sp.]
MAVSSILSQKIAIVDDHSLVRKGLAVYLFENGVNEVEQFNDSMSLIARMDSGVSFDFYIIDLELPDLDGFVLIEMIRARNPVAHIIVSTVHDEIWTLRKILARDVNAIIYKSGEGEEIISAIKEIINGGTYYCDAVKNVMSSVTDNTLHPSQRELEVLYQIAQGKTSREIAGALFVSDNTVEAHRRSLFQKLGATNVADLIVKAINKGYIKRCGTLR